MSDYIPNHIERALDNLESQFQHSPNLKAVLRAIVTEVQVLEDAIYSMTVDRFLEGAGGAQLDLYGRVLGAERAGSSDAVYRTVLSARILGNRSAGELERLISVYKLLNAEEDVQIQPVYPNTVIFSVTIHNPIAQNARDRVVRWMHQIKKAGVALIFVEAAPGYFGFAGDPDALGFGAGIFSGVIQDG